MGGRDLLRVLLTIHWSLLLRLMMFRYASEIQYWKRMCPCISKPKDDYPSANRREGEPERLAYTVGKAKCTSLNTLSPVSTHQLHQGHHTIVSAAVEMVTSPWRLSVDTRSGRCAILQQRYYGVVLEMVDDWERDTCPRT